MGEGSERDLASAIRALGRERIERLRAKEVEAMVRSFYAEDALFLPPDEPLLRGREEIREFWTGRVEEGLLEFSLDPLTIESSGDLAYEVGTFMLTIRHHYGGPLRQHGKYMVVYRRGPDATWRAVADTFNGDRDRH